jgi:dynein heavy chain, axonemal
MYDLQHRLQQSKDNVEMIQKLMNCWCRTPLFERIEGKHSTLLNLADREDRLRKRYEDITQAGIKIHQLVQVKSLRSFILSKFS